ncbi:NADP-dependent malic enzyme [archaeon]|nr:NADP-dependent malic enzyme [archaeon]
MNSEDPLDFHKKYAGKIEITPKAKVDSRKILSLAYTPGVAAVSMSIAEDTKRVYEYTIKPNTVAVVTDGSAVLGLGNIGPEAALPVMEGKCMLFKELGGVDAFPICLATQDTEKIIETVKNIAPVFGGINLEDIAAPKCFEIEERLQDIGIPVMHDDQHATAIVVQAALQNASRVVEKDLSQLNVVISGAGAAGITTARMLRCINIDEHICTSVKNIIVCDSNGIIHRERADLNAHKKQLLEFTNRGNMKGTLIDAMKGADVFIGLSTGNVVTESMVRSMADKPIIFAMANPVPEIMPDIALKAGAVVVGTGRSDFPNQINNVLAFPGVFRGTLDARAKKITNEMKIAAANALARSVDPCQEKILPEVLDRFYVKLVAKAVEKEAMKVS